LLCIISLCFSLLHALLFILLLFSLPFYFVHVQDLSTFSLFIRFILPYFALFSLHCIPVYFALLCFFTLPRFGLLCFVLSLCFPYFSWSSFRSDFNFTSSWGVSCPIPCLTCFVEPRTFYFLLFCFALSRMNLELWRNPSRIDGAM